MPQNDKVIALVAQMSDEPALKDLKQQLNAANQAFEDRLHNLGDQLNLRSSTQEQKSYELIAAPIRRQMASAIHQKDGNISEIDVRRTVVAMETEVEEKRRTTR